MAWPAPTQNWNVQRFCDCCKARTLGIITDAKGEIFHCLSCHTERKS